MYADTRKFIAFDLPPQIRRTLEVLQRRLLDCMRISSLQPSDIRLMPQPYLLLILDDLGEQPDEIAEVIEHILDHILVHRGQINANFKGISCIPGPTLEHNGQVCPTTLIAANVEDPGGRISLLREDLHRELLRRDFELDARPFRPHIVFAQIRGALPDLSSLDCIAPLRLQRLALFQPRPIPMVDESPLGTPGWPHFRPRFGFMLDRLAPLAPSADELAQAEAEHMAELGRILDERLKNVPKTILRPAPDRRTLRRLAELRSQETSTIDAEDCDEFDNDFDDNEPDDLDLA